MLLFSHTGRARVVAAAGSGDLAPREVTIRVNGRDLAQSSDESRRVVERGWGILFQRGALFSSLTVLENVLLPAELTRTDGAERRAREVVELYLGGRPASDPPI